MKSKTIVTLLIAIAFGLVTAKIGYDLMASKPKGAAAAPMVKVVVAQHDLAPGRLLTEADITTAAIPAELAGKTDFKDAKELLGRALVSPIVKGQTLFEGLLAPRGTLAGMQSAIPDGKRAITVEVSDVSGTTDMIVPGCRVDVIATLHKGDRSVARTIVENVKVSAVDGRVAMAAPDKPNDRRVAHAVTLIVAPEQAEAIELAAASAKPRLVLRGSSDDSSYESSGVSSAALLGEPDPEEKPEPPAETAAAKVAPATQPVVVAPPAPEPEPSVSVQYIRKSVVSWGSYNPKTGEMNAEGASGPKSTTTTPPKLANDPADAAHLLQDKSKGI